MALRTPLFSLEKKKIGRESSYVYLRYIRIVFYGNMAGDLHKKLKCYGNSENFPGVNYLQQL